MRRAASVSDIAWSTRARAASAKRRASAMVAARCSTRSMALRVISSAACCAGDTGGAGSPNVGVGCGGATGGGATDDALLSSSLIRSAQALERLCCVLAITTLYLVTQGTEVVTHGKRRWVDAHWFRGQSYLKIGWHWVHLALSRGYALMTRMHLSAEADPAPAMASKIQHQKQPQLFLTL